MLTAREARDFALYCQTSPIDDQANHHWPIASLQATVANIMGGQTKPEDFLLFREREEQSIDELLLGSGW